MSIDKSIKVTIDGEEFFVKGGFTKSKTGWVSPSVCLACI